MRQATDEQVALYLEEHEPSLQAEIISAVEASRGPGGPVAGAGEAAGRVGDREVPGARARQRVEREPLNGYAVAFGAVVLATLALFALGPAYLRHALSALLVVSRSVEAAVPYRIEVQPGNVNVPRGADQAITAEAARLHGGAAGPDGAQVSRRSIRARAAHPRRRQVPGHAVRPAGPARLLRRSGRRAVHDLSPQGHRDAVRAAARARVPLPGLHRARAAEDRGRRRHRRPARHRDPRARGADDGDQGRPDRPERPAGGGAGGRGRRGADVEVRGRQGRLLSRSSWMRRPATV